MPKNNFIFPKIVVFKLLASFNIVGLPATRGLSFIYRI